MTDGVFFDFKDANVSKQVYDKYSGKLKTELDGIKKGLKVGYDGKYASINLPSDDLILKDVGDVLKKTCDAKSIVVVGIGGSNLGTMALCEGVRGKFYNLRGKRKAYFVDTCDGDFVRDVEDLVREDLKKGEKIVVNVVSKSGGTTETIANFEYLFSRLYKYKKKIYFVFTTQNDSKLWEFGEKMGCFLLDVPKKVGGRYSVFSSVGLFPLAFLGVDVNGLRKGAMFARSLCLQSNVYRNPAMWGAISVYENYMKGRNIVNSFVFSNQLESFGKWYRQLLAESVGKEWNESHRKKVKVGITPIVSVGSTELHSVGQLFLGGPNDKYHFFVKVAKMDGGRIGKVKDLAGLMREVENKDLLQIMNAIILGTENAFRKRKIPFCSVTIPSLNEFCLGVLMQEKMIETMFLGKLLDVNPFDQPNVEEYKKVTKEILES